MTNPRERLIVVLDVDSKDKALGIVDELGNNVIFYKVGLELFLSAGYSVIEEINNRGKRIFLDLKFHDIPNTVARASVVAASYDVFMFNMHILGGREMMKAAMEEARKINKNTKIIGVTLLTSMNEEAISETGIIGPIQERVSKLALMAEEIGLDGVVASSLESKILIRESS